MNGSERQKFCDRCGHHVANLSLLSAEERAALLARARDQSVCGSYFVRLSGELVTPERPLSFAESRSLRQFGIATLSAAALAVASGCVSQPQNKTANEADLRTRLVALKTSNKEEKKEAENKDDKEVLLIMGMIVSGPEDGYIKAKPAESDEHDPISPPHPK